MEERKSMPEKKALMCQPISFRGYVVPGSLPEKCSKCDGLVWVSPSSLLALHDNPEMKILCMPCTIEQMKKDGEFEIEGITPAQVEEIKEYLDSR